MKLDGFFKSEVAENNKISFKEFLEEKFAKIHFVGPVGTAKSTFVSIIKKALERYSRTEDGEIYAIEFCPIHENLLNLISEDARDDFYG